MHNSPTLLVLVAGMATRYGGLKQLDCFGPNGETIIEYSVHDAYKAGFDKIVFVVRETIKEEFKAIMQQRIPEYINIEYVTQELEMLPLGYEVPENRSKPWGTGQAVWVAASSIKEPFAVINGDDFYGYESFKLAADFLKTSADNIEYGLVGFKLENTLSDHGAVSRGICELNENNYLKSVTEQTHIIRISAGIAVQGSETSETILVGQEIVSMNLMAFKPSVFPYFEQEFKAFLDRNSTNSKAEFYLPAVVDAVVKSGAAKVKVLRTPEKWFGVTYPNDKQYVVQSINHLISKGIYAKKMWDSLSVHTI